MNLLTLENVTSGYQDAVVIEEISLSVEEEEITVLIGPNGAGKSTLLKTILGFLEPKNGKVLYKGADITGELTEDIAKDYKIGYIPEEEGVFPNLTVEENLTLALSVVEIEDSEAAKGKAYDLFPRLEERKDQKAGSMSGGERKFLSVANSVVKSPDLLLVDEVSLGVMPTMVDDIYNAIGELVESGVTALLSEQDVSKALEIGNYGYLIEGGKIRVEGPSSELLENEKIEDAYLGVL